jgi:hypothetical protein
MKTEVPKRGSWVQSPPRDQMVSTVRALAPGARSQRLSIGLGKQGHIDDEAVVTLVLDAWDAKDRQAADTYSAALLHRVTKHVRAHARKNPAWAVLGGGRDAAESDFCQDVVLAILSDANVPSHSELRFGQFVHRRCLDGAGKLYAKKHSAGSSLEDVEDGDFEAQAQEGDPAEPSAESKSPEAFLIEIEEMLRQDQTLKDLPAILQKHVPELARNAFTYKYYGQMKIESTRSMSIQQLMGLDPKTVAKYIDQAIDIIKMRVGK